MPWVKLFIDLLDDHKVGKLPRSPRLRFIELLLIAGECDADGGLINGGTPMTVADIAWRLRDSVESVGADIAALIAAGLLNVDSDVLCIVNFSKRQGRSQAEKRAQWRERKVRQRGNPPSGGNASRVTHAGIPPSDAGDSPPRVEESRGEEEESRGDVEGSAGAPPASSTPPSADDTGTPPNSDDTGKGKGRPRKSPANITMETADDDRVKAYLRILHQHEITPTNVGYIKERVSDLVLWEATLTRWAQGDGERSWGIKEFGKMFDNYDRRVIAASTKTPGDAKPSAQPQATPAPLTGAGKIAQETFERQQEGVAMALEYLKRGAYGNA
jgi:hypothetical protein